MIPGVLLFFLIWCSSPATPHPPDRPPTGLCSTLSHSYAEMDTAAVRLAHRHATGKTDRLLALYRLFPLTRNADLLDDLPEDLGPDAEARDVALLAALWSFRIESERIWNRIPVARRSQGLLRRAREMAPDDPFVLLVEGQFLLYTPRIAGGDRTEALSRFRQLRHTLERRPVCGLSLIEVDTWIWVTLDKLDAPEADEVRTRLLADHPPALYRSVLMDL